MTATLQLCTNPVDQLQATALAPYAGIYEGDLSDRGYAPSTREATSAALFTVADG